MTRAMWVLPWMLWTGCVVGGGESEWRFEDAEGVWVNLGSGEINVVSEDRNDAVIRWDGGGIGKPARPEIDQGDDGWVVMDAGGLLGGGDITVAVPLGLPVEAFVDRGDLSVSFDEAADLVACVAAGDLSIRVPPGPYDLQIDGAVGSVSSGGIIDDPDAAHTLHACVAAGEITLRSTE